MPIGVRTPGPRHHFVRFRFSSTAFYLGTAIVAPDAEQEKMKLEVMNDLSGRSVPFQLVQDGEKWTVLTTLNRFDLNVVRAIQGLESGQLPISVPPLNPGSETGLARGTLSMGITDFELVLVNQYAGTVSAGSFAGQSDLAIGRRWYYCNMRKYGETTKGTRVLDVSMAIECLGGFNLTTRGFDTWTEGNLGNLAVII